jgi:hypothetical protein
MAIAIMSPIRAWAPAIGAVFMLLLCLAVAIHTSRAAVDLPPLPAAVHVRGTDVADLGAEISAPLFTPSRTLAAAGESATTPPAPPPQLTGIVLGGGRAVALVKSANGGDTRMLHAGETVDGWTIVGIAARQIIVARDGAQQTVALEFGASKPQSGDISAAQGGTASGRASSPSFDGLAAAARLGLPATNIPLGSPLGPRQ